MFTLGPALCYLKKQVKYLGGINLFGLKPRKAYTLIKVFAVRRSGLRGRCNSGIPGADTINSSSTHWHFTKVNLGCSIMHTTLLSGATTIQCLDNRS